MVSSKRSSGARRAGRTRSRRVRSRARSGQRQLRLGYKAEGDVAFGWDNIGFSGKAGGTVGLGAEADINISVDPSAVVHGIESAFNYFGW